VAFVFRIGPGDWTRCRFAYTRLQQVANAVRLLREPLPAGAPPWVEHLHRTARAEDFHPLLRLMPKRAFGVDFLTPPGGPKDSWADELDRVAGTDPELVRDEVARCLTEQGLPVDVDPDLPRLVHLVDDAWRRLVQPFWPQVQDVLEADIARRAGAVAAGGLGAGLADLAPDATLVGSAVIVGTGATADVDLKGRGLLLMPHAYGPTTGALWEPPWEPSIVYPAAGAWAFRAAPEASEALARLLGATRARLLIALVDPATTSGLAARCELPLSSVSEHLAVLRAAGLVSAVRRRYAVQHRRTPLGDALAAR
jgi:hypothetical protein